MGEAGSELSDAIRVRAVDGHLRLDEYLAVVAEVASRHGHDPDALHAWFAAGEGRGHAVVLSDPDAIPRCP